MGIPIVQILPSYPNYLSSLGHDGGQMVSVLALDSKDASSNPIPLTSTVFILLKLLEKNEKDARDGPFKTLP